GEGGRARWGRGRPGGGGGGGGGGRGGAGGGGRGRGGGVGGAWGASLGGGGREERPNLARRTAVSGRTRRSSRGAREPMPQGNRCRGLSPARAARTAADGHGMGTMESTRMPEGQVIRLRLSLMGRPVRNYSFEKTQISVG